MGCVPLPARLLMAPPVLLLLHSHGLLLPHLLPVLLLLLLPLQPGWWPVWLLWQGAGAPWSSQPGGW
jgi:hypothetical protein